ncbi:MAG: branched-chain amino acid ABC transporter permease [Roseiarcus sp.]
MNFVIQTLVDAVSVGSLYALSALGIGLLFGIMRLVNFAQGEFITIGIYALMVTVGLWFPLAGVVALACVLLVALLAERFAFRPVRDADPSTMLITSFAVSYFLQYSIVLIFGARPIGFNLLPELGEAITIGDVRIARVDIVTITTAAVLLAGITFLLQRTRIGIEMRAAAVDFRMARVLGIRANRIIATAFAISGVLSGFVSVLVAAQSGTASPTIGTQIALVGFVATVIGGMGSLVGAVLGGLAVGVMAVIFQAILPVDLRPFRDALVYGAVIVVLVVRPQGLFRSAATLERV